MRAVGVRELREKTTEILREVSETGETVEVTRRGKVMARLVPPGARSPEDIKGALERAHQLMERIGERVAGPTDASTVMTDERRW